MNASAESTFRLRLQAVQNRIQKVCEAVGRDPKDIEVVLVSKQVDPQRIHEAYQAGVRDFGENRVQELVRKQEQLPRDIRWHFIGHLQTNKVKDVLGRVVLIHSLDRFSLAEALQKEAEKQSQSADVLIQVNTSDDGAKRGFHAEDLEQAVSKMIRCDRLNMKGLMTIGPFTEDQSRIRDSFRLLKNLRDRMKDRFKTVNWRYLSMGMSSDFEVALEEGANCLRIGSAMFGSRDVKG